MQKLFYLIFLSGLVIFSNGCKPDEPEPVKPFVLKLTEQGTTKDWVATSSQAVIRDAGSSTSTTLITAINGTETIKLEFRNVIGTYTSDNVAPYGGVECDFIRCSACSPFTEVTDGFTVQVTSSTATNIKGTFSGKVSDKSPVSPYEFTMSNGTFDISY